MRNNTNFFETGNNANPRCRVAARPKCPILLPTVPFPSDWKKHETINAWKELDDTHSPQKTTQAQAAPAKITLALALVLIVWGSGAVQAPHLRTEGGEQPNLRTSSDGRASPCPSRFTFIMPEVILLNAVARPGRHHMVDLWYCSHWTSLTRSGYHMPSYATLEVCHHLPCGPISDQPRGLRFAKLVDRDGSRIFVHINHAMPVRQSSSSKRPANAP